MLQYVVDHMDHDFSVLQSFKPENLRFTLNDEDPSTIAYEISKSAVDLNGDPVVIGNDFISPWDTHWRLRYGPDVTICAGVHNSVKMSYGDNFMSVSGTDWLGYFDRRFIPFDGRDGHHYDKAIGSTPGGVIYQATDVDIADALTAVLDLVLGMTNSIPFTYNLSSTGVVMDHFRLDMADTSTLLSIVKSICGYNPGVTFEITPARVFQIASPRWYGEPNDIAADPDNVNLIWTVNTSHPPVSLDFTNVGPACTHIQGESSGTATREVITLGNLENQEVYWRTDKGYQFEDAITRASAEARTHEQFAFDLNPQHEIPLTLDPDIVDKQQDNPNLITNDGFETNTTGWSVDGGSTTITRIATEFKFDTHSCEVAADAINHGIKYALSGLTASTRYRFIVYCLVPIGINYNVSCDGTGGVTSSMRTGTGLWQKVQIEFTTGAAQTSTNLKITNRTTGAHTFYVDGASVIEVGVNDGFFWTTFKPGRAIWIDLQLVAHHIDSAHHIVAMDCKVDANGVAGVSLEENQIYDTSGLAHVYEG